jgi:hypothetical protein
MGDINKLKYKKINNFLDINEINLMSLYCKHMVRKRLHDVEQIDSYQIPSEYGYYGDPLMEALLENKTKIIEEHTKFELYPTYSFWRMYTYGATLFPHKDRKECEVSVSVHIDGDHKWPLIVEDKELFTNPGDAIIYLGKELKHERKVFKGDYQTQVFLHFVNKNGEFAKKKYDGRIALGQIQ